MKFIMKLGECNYFNSLQHGGLWNLASKELASEISLKKARFLIKKHLEITNKNTIDLYKILLKK